MHELVVHVLFGLELAAGGNLDDVGGEVVGASGEVDVGAEPSEALPRLDLHGVAVDGVGLVDGDALGLDEVGVGEDSVERVGFELVAHGCGSSSLLCVGGERTRRGGSGGSPPGPLKGEREGGHPCFGPAPCLAQAQGCPSPTAWGRGGAGRAARFGGMAARGVSGPPPALRKRKAVPLPLRGGGGDRACCALLGEGAVLRFGPAPCLAQAQGCPSPTAWGRGEQAPLFAGMAARGEGRSQGAVTGASGGSRRRTGACPIPWASEGPSWGLTPRPLVLRPSGLARSMPLARYSSSWRSRRRSSISRRRSAFLRAR